MTVRIPALVFAAALAHPALAQTELWNNGPFETTALTWSGVNANTFPPATLWSEAQHNEPDRSASNGIAGFAAHTDPTSGNTFRVADDFTIPAGQTWRISRVCVFHYQTGFATWNPGPFNNITVRVWNGRPRDAGAAVIFGDQTTNRFARQIATNTLRVFSTVAPLEPPPGAPTDTRKIFRVEADFDPPIELTAGTYWLDWRTGPLIAWAVPVTSRGFRVPQIAPRSANARQFNGAGTPPAWQDIIDTGSPAAAPDLPQDLAFILKGSIVGGGTCPGQGPGACGPGDWNEDGTVDFNDLLAFLNDYNAQTQCADVNQDGAVDFNDLLEFLNRYNASC